MSRGAAGARWVGGIPPRAPKPARASGIEIPASAALLAGAPPSNGLPETAAILAAAKLTGVRVNTTFFVCIDRMRGGELSSQPPSSWCCNDRLNPPNTCRSSTPSLVRPASSHLSAASAILRQCARRNDQRALQGRGHSSARAVAQLRGRRVRLNGSLVQQSRLLEPIEISRRPKPSALLCAHWGTRHGVTQTASGKPGAVHSASATSFGWRQTRHGRQEGTPCGITSGRTASESGSRPGRFVVPKLP